MLGLLREIRHPVLRGVRLLRIPSLNSLLLLLGSTIWRRCEARVAIRSLGLAHGLRALRRRVPAFLARHVRGRRGGVGVVSGLVIHGGVPAVRLRLGDPSVQRLGAA